MWTAFISVLCFLADHSSWILGLYIISLLLRLGRMGMLLRGGQAADCFKREWECGMQIDVFGCSEVSLGRRAALADT
ncbi:unnamed protein product [Prunus armeniaca]|uniref:Uncharacterized protein n=1 Tax=Prunus armeniaca TaxID=36596 RepID=A0A6J5TTP0_PRUAR|nr:unnamed protein product [Prunus armeniaca]